MPTVTCKLWQPTLNLLSLHKSNHPTYVLADDDGEPLCHTWRDGDKVKERNPIRDAYRYVIDNLDPALPKGKSFKSLRATGATLLESHDVFGRYGPLYLGHVAQTLIEKHYALKGDEIFIRAIKWLGEQLPFLKKTP